MRVDNVPGYSTTEILTKIRGNENDERNEASVERLTAAPACRRRLGLRLFRLYFFEVMLNRRAGN